MVKRIAVLLSAIMLSSQIDFAQKTSGLQNSGVENSKLKDSTFNFKINSSVTKPSRDAFMIQLGYNNWITKPDSVKTKSMGYVLNAYLCYDFPIKKSHLSFAAGIGINASTVYLDHQRLIRNDTGVLGNAARILDDSTNIYKRYKFTTAYLQAPFELRYFGNLANRNKGFKAAIGVQVGTLLGAHTKGLRSVGGVNVKDKEASKRYVSPWNFAATARVGMGNFTLFAAYNITNTFKDSNGPAVTPFSMGLCISGL